MKVELSYIPSWLKRSWIVFTLFWLSESSAHASHVQGETLDQIANIIAIFLLFFVPVAGVAIFLVVHILPEKLAEKRGHPQLAAIKVLCLLSLVFGGLLWPLAWIWAFSKPVLHKLAYGTDFVDYHADKDAQVTDPALMREEILRLKAELAAAEVRLGGKSLSTEG